jgi:endoglucanase
MDNRLGAYVALEALRRCHERGSLRGSFAAIAAVQEEIGLFGARTSAFAVEPDLAVVVDVTHATDAPGVDEKELGTHTLGSGPVLFRGATLSPRVFELLVETAEEAGIEHTLGATGNSTGTDADAVQFARSGIPTGLVAIPLRYMHSPVEMVDLADVEATVELIAAFAARLDGSIDLSR